MEQIMEQILASQERMEALMDVILEMREACLGSNQKKLETKMEACPVRMETNQEKLKVTYLEVYPEEIQAIAVASGNS
jgi:hypothetical protein